MRSIPLTAAGLLVLGLGAAAYVGGWQLGWVELMVLAAGCILALVLAVPFVLGRLKLEVVRTLQPARVMVGETSLAVLEVINPGSTSIRPRIIEDAVADQHVRIEVPALGGGENHQTVYNLPTKRRGVVKVGPAVIARQDPLQLMRREVSQAHADTLWIHPRYVPLVALPVGFAKDLEGPTSDTSPAGDVAFHALREYEVGDDYRHIHWMSTARTGTPMVRHYVDNRKPELTVVLDDREGSCGRDTFEVAVEVVASLTVSAVLHQQPIAAWTTEGPLVGRTRGGARDDVLDRLSLVQQRAEGDLERAALAALRYETGTSALVIVTGGLPAEELVVLVSQARRKARVLVVRVWDQGNVQPGVIPGAKVIDVDSLAQFQRAWERTAR